jgi:hypothetical protein
MSSDPKWIERAHLKKRALHRELGVPQGRKIPSAKLHAAMARSGIVGKRARLANTLRGLH